MRLYGAQFIALVSLLLVNANAGHTDNQAEDYTNHYSYSQPMDKDSVLLHQFQDLRMAHEGAVYLLKRYATLEALLTAKDRGREDTEAFAIGAASLIPGAGQMINQDYLQGGILLFAGSMSWGTIRQLEFTRRKEPAAEALLPGYYASLALRNGIMTYAMLHAANAAYRKDRDRTRAMWIGTASLLPGVGQAINNDWWEACGLLVAWSAASVLTSSLETRIYVQGDEGYLVREKPSAWNLAWLPGAAFVSWTESW